MDEFEKLVGELKAATGNKEIVEKLQAIMSKLLTECVIQAGSFEVEPLLVEAYYYNCDETHGFQDENCHKAPEQKDNWMNLYCHKTGRGGVDLCLSDGPYYLSFLIKCARVNSDTICSQAALYDTLFDHGVNVDLTTRNTTPEQNPVAFNPRRNLAKPTYQSDLLAAILIDALKYKTVQQSLAKGYSRQWVLAQYAYAQTGCDKSDVSSFLNKCGLYSGNIDKSVIARL